MKQAFSSQAPSVPQMVLWMREFSEMAILDFILSQQDRIENVDYKWFWLYNDNGEALTKSEGSELPRTRMSKIAAPTELASKTPMLLQRTMISDNDAGGLPMYSNFTKKSKMLENLRHIHADTYTNLMKLNQDLQAKGPIYQGLDQNYGLKSGVLAMLATNTQLAAGILKATCEAKKLRFDRTNYKTVLTKGFEEVPAQCAL
ncbi:MAG: hypothetical protein EOP06_14740 [Proteobacteria bacterium]|nr:MAG: hypothetical protein EOP06_14740 [Pseudomonadota bacterium]